jgi:O-antigen ligase
MNFNTTLAQRVRLHAHEYESFITVLLVVSIYFSTTLAIVVSAILGVVWLLSTQFIELPGTLKRNPVAAWAMLLLFWFILGSCYTSATSSDAFSMIMKYRELLLIPVLISFLTTERYRSWVWKAFFITYVLALLFSYLMYVGILDLNNQGDPSFKGRITHSIFISFFAFFCAHKAYDGQRYTKLY